MKMNLLRRGFALTLVVSILSGCGGGIDPLEVSESSHSDQELVDYKLDPETFTLDIIKDNEYVSVSQAMPQPKRVENLSQDNGITEWSYPDDGVDVSVRANPGYLSVNIISNTDSDNSFRWPSVTGDSYFFPLGEGKRIPADDSVWVDYFSQMELNVLEQFSMPFLASVQDEYAVVFIMEDPYRTTLNFDDSNKISFSVLHSYPEIDENKQNSFRIYVTQNDPTSVAKLYRDYVIENDKFVTLQEKAALNPDIEKLFGAAHIYLAGDFIISPENINWQGFRKALNSDIIEYLLSFSQRTEVGEEIKTTIDKLREQDYVDSYQKNIICKYISEVLDEADFYDKKMLPLQDDAVKEILSSNKKDTTSIIQLNKYALAANAPNIFHAADTWMNDATVDLLSEFKESGIDKAWIGLHSWEQAFSKPNLTKAAVNAGYLIAPYDSYHSIHESGKEKWITAKFDDISLYENATIIGKNGEKISGFQSVGRKLNPTLSLPSVKSRVDSILSNPLTFNSWFIDCDATGEIYDDYSKEHTTTQQQDLQARLERMDYIRDNYNMVIGSEGGNDFAASTIAFAHGIELRTFAWMDDDMKRNKDSEYYMGKYYSPTGGVTENFAKRVPIKEHLYSLFLDPSYDIPLFKLVYNDSVITTYHWDWSTFKIIGATQDRMLREVLYNVPPLYHLDRTQWEQYGEDIANHTKVWSDFSEKVITKEMTNFKMLTDDATVQMTEYGDEISVIANFGETPFTYEGQEILASSLIIKTADGVSSYTPNIKEANR